MEIHSKIIVDQIKRIQINVRRELCVEVNKSYRTQTKPPDVACGGCEMSLFKTDLTERGNCFSRGAKFHSQFQPIDLLLK